MKLYRILVFGSLVGWLASLACPALSFRFDGEHDRVLRGYQILASGYWHLLVLEPSWLANFGLMFVSWELWHRPERTRPLVIGAAVTLLLTAESARIFLWDHFFQHPKAFVGYYLWVGSIGLLCGGAFAYSAIPRMDAETSSA